MNREIEFKAKRKDNGKWVCGLLAPIFSFKDGIVFKICEVYKDSEGNLTGFEVFEVEQETISQFTGLKDKNGKEIYEGDIVFRGNNYIKPYGVISFENGVFDTFDLDSWSLCDRYEECEVIGNIHDNKELL